MRRHLSLVVAAPLLGVYLVAGVLGLMRYIDNYWRYRGFAVPHDPAYVKTRGTTQKISVMSAAIGRRAQAVYVYLPPGYASHPQRRYPVFYLLHGYPGRPQGAFLWTNQVGVDEDVLVAKHIVNPAILVMPYGATGFLDDKEWANGIGRGAGWETFVASDVVRAIDSRYRTIRNGRGRALGGLSAGGYGALNIGLHHPGEFDVLESWSGYVVADHVKSVFDDDRRLLRWNSPLLTLRASAPALRQAGTFIWLYIGSDDHLTAANEAFDARLQRARITHRFNIFRGGHDWALWRAQTPNALIIASNHLAHG
jgi:enterochelin esterase-like enzyme